MNVGRSVRIALEQRDLDGRWLSSQLGMTRQRASQLRTRTKANSATIARLATVFNLKVSEFIALGEIENEV
jgi:predicted XRE-type DNA-binding protein